jgi:hypothetical protein
MMIQITFETLTSTFAPHLTAVATVHTQSKSSNIFGRFLFGPQYKPGNRTVTLYGSVLRACLLQMGRLMCCHSTVSCCSEPNVQRSSRVHQLVSLYLREGLCGAFHLTLLSQRKALRQAGRDIGSRRKRWARRVVRMRNAYRVLLGKPEGRKRFGRRRSEDKDKVTTGHGLDSSG